MTLKDILSEGDLRKWLSEHAPHVKVALQWVEPSLYGSSIGAPDVIMAHGVDIPVSVELKVLMRMTKGIKFTVRPAQRRWHHMGMRTGRRSALLFIELASNNKLWLMRGDKIPLRDYASHPDSGCELGLSDMWQVNALKINDLSCMEYLKSLLFIHESKFWTHK
jgi:hypothetical protein